MKTKKIIYACLILVSFIFEPKILNAQENTPLKAIEVIGPLTTLEEGGGARPEIIFLNGQWYMVYRDSAARGGSFRLKNFGRSLGQKASSRVLVSSGAKGGVTDIRMTTDGGFVYAAYETASAQGRKLFVEKYDSQFRLLISRQAAEAARPGRGVEALDDPAVVVGNNHVYVMTKVGIGQGQRQYRVREFNLDLTPTGAVFEIGTELNIGLGSVSSVVFADGNFYVVTTVHVSGRPVCPSADETTNNDLYVFLYDKDWRFTGFSKAITSGPHIEYYPTGFKYADGKFYIVYLVNDPETYLPHCGQGGNLGIGKAYLLVLDKNFNPLINQKITAGSEIVNHPTLEVAGGQIYVAYGRKEREGLGLGSSNIWVRVFEFY